MSVVALTLILGILIFVHELGHFLLAKQAKVRVDEFALGFPPTIWKKKIGETTYKLNSIPFGGYVAIHGENPSDDSLNGPDASRSLTSRSKLTQISVLLAGILFNLIFAWLLLSVGYISGVPTPVSQAPGGIELSDISVYVTAITPGSPADKAGMLAGSIIRDVSKNGISLETISFDSIISYIPQNTYDSLFVTVETGGATETFELIPAEGIIPDRAAIGISMSELGILKLPVHTALIEGLKLTVHLADQTVRGFGLLISDAFRGDASITSLTGPVGLVGIVGDASKIGFIYILTLSAFISINLAIINLVPFPALDGGRILFVVIETIIRKPIKPKIANIVNATGFILLILLMLIVTYHDIARLF